MQRDNRTVSLSLLILGAVLSSTGLLGLFLPYPYAEHIFHGTLGTIIWYYFGYTFVILLLGFLLVVLSFIPSIARDPLKEACSVSSMLCTALLAAVAAGVTYCGMHLFVFAAFGEVSRHPIVYQCSISGFMWGALMILALLVWYLVIRIKRFSVKGLLIDVTVLTTVYIPALLAVEMFHYVFDHYVFV